MKHNMHPWIRFADGGDAGGGAEQAAAPQTTPAPASESRGFPEGTPLEQMSVEQREAYWKHYARKHEEAAKQFEGLTPDAVAELRDKAERFDALEYELQSDHDKALDAARKEAAEAARSELLPQLVKASFDAHAARLGVDADQLEAALKFADLGKFVTKGQVDGEAIAEYVGTMKPAGPKLPQHPSGIGLGNRGVGGFLPGERGRAEAERRFGSKS